MELEFESNGFSHVSNTGSVTVHCTLLNVHTSDSSLYRDGSKITPHRDFDFKDSIEIKFARQQKTRRSYLEEIIELTSFGYLTLLPHQYYNLLEIVTNKEVIVEIA